MSQQDQNTHRLLDVSIWRGKGAAGQFTKYQVPQNDSQTVLDVVTYVQRHIDPNLTYRFACRVGMCGSCAMMVNGKPMWTCRTHVDKAIGGGSQLTIAPLRNMPVIKDLACDMSGFFEKWTHAEGRFQGQLDRNDPIVPVNPSSERRVAANAAIECINCAVCYAACDVVEQNDDYLGPAALNRAWTLINDERDIARSRRLKAISAEGGCQNCHSQQGCSQFCPNELNPTRSIAGLKRESVKAVLRGEI